MKLTRRIAALLALIMLFAALGASASARGAYLGAQRVVNCQSWVTLRARPSTGAGTVARVPLGASVECYYYNSQFMECYYNGLHGYILSTYLSNGSSGSSSSSSSRYMGKKYIVNCNEFVTLRSGPSTRASTVTKVARGQVVDAYAYNSQFAECYYNGLHGYILTRYLGGSPSGGGSGYSAGASMGTRRIVNCQSWVTLRARPSTSAATVTRISKGQTVQAYYYNSQFAECYYNGLHGYILLNYLG